MQITIDTLKDSHHDIRKAIRLLTALVAESSGNAGFFDNTPPEPANPVASPPPAVSSAMDSFFGGMDTATAAMQPAPDRKDRPKIQLY